MVIDLDNTKRMIPMMRMVMIMMMMMNLMMKIRMAGVDISRIEWMKHP